MVMRNCLRFSMVLLSTVALGISGALPAAAQEPKTKKANTASIKEPIDVNTASAEELQQLPGIGPALAKAIIEGRPYSSVADLERVKGLGTARLAELKGLVKASRPAPAKAKTKAAGEPKKGGAAKPHEAPVDLNTASAAELERLPGVGPAIAKAIIEGRPYESVEDLSRVRGIGESKLEDLTDLVVVHHAAPARAKAAEPKKAPRTTTAAPKAKTKPALASGKRVNVNTATREELEELPLIGPIKAQGIIDGRPFASVEDLKNVKGIGEVTFTTIKDLVTVK